MVLHEKLFQVKYTKRKTFPGKVFLRQLYPRCHIDTMLVEIVFITNQFIAINKMVHKSAISQSVIDCSSTSSLCNALTIVAWTWN